MVSNVSMLRQVLGRVKGELKIDGWRITWEDLRYAFISRELLMRITKRMMEILGASFKEAVLRFTALSCFAEASFMINMGTPPEEVVEKCAEFVSASGWGLVNVVEADLNKPKVIVEMYNPGVALWFRSNVKNLEKVFPFYECAWWGYSWIGVVMAALEAMGVEAPPLVYKETKCYARGDECCEFVIEKGPERVLEPRIPRELFNYKNVKRLVDGRYMCGDPKETIGLFLKILEAREDGSIGIMGGDSMFMAPSLLFSLAYWTIPVEKFGESICATYRMACNEYGEHIARQGERYGAEGVLRFFLSSASSMGWGGMEVAEYTESNVTFHIYQSLYGEDGGAYFKLKESEPRPVCAPIGYIAEGITNYFAKKEGRPPLAAKEEKCIAKGDKYCEFTLEKQG